MGLPRGTEKSTKMMTVTLVVTMLLWGGAMAQSSQQSACTNALVGLAPCLGYITGLVTVPSSPCCKQLSSIVDSQPQCLCQLVNGNSFPLGVAINKAQALALPGACNVETPDVSLCSLINQPSGSGGTGGSTAGSPSTSPTDDASTPDSSETPESPTTTTPSTISGTGAKSSTGSISNGNITKFSINLTLFLLFITSSASTIFRIV